MLTVKYSFNAIQLWTSLILYSAFVSRAWVVRHFTLCTARPVRTPIKVVRHSPYVQPLLCPDRREGDNKRSFCLSVCLSVRRVARIIRELKGLACPNLEWIFPTLDADRTPVSRSNGQILGLQTGGGISCRPNPAATLLVQRWSRCVAVWRKTLWVGVGQLEWVCIGRKTVFTSLNTSPAD